MTAVSEVDRYGAIAILTVVAVIFVVDGVRNLVRANQAPPPGPVGTRQAPGCRPQPVEPGTFSAADSTHRESVAGPSPRRPSAAESIDTLTFPGPYSRIGNRR